MILGRSKFELDGAVFYYGLTSYQLVVYVYLRFCAGRQLACRVKLSTIAANCGCSKSTVRRALKELRERGFLDIRADAQPLNGGGTRQTCNRYYLLDRSEWKG